MNIFEYRYWSPDKQIYLYFPETSSTLLNKLYFCIFCCMENCNPHPLSKRMFLPRLIFS